MENNSIQKDKIKENSLQDLIKGFKLHDEKYLKITKNFQIVFWIMIGLYSALFIINPDKELLLTDRLGGISYVSAFLIFLFIYKKYYKELKSIDYTVPTAVMLKNSIDRYKLFHSRTALLIIPILLIDFGVTLSFIQRLDEFVLINRILIVQAFYIPVMLVSFIIGVLIWYTKQKPLRDKAKELLQEIEE